MNTSKHPRIFLTGVTRELPLLQSLQVVWPSGLESGVYDFGRATVSVYLPMRLQWSPEKGEVFDLFFRINEEKAKLKVKAIRSETRFLVAEIVTSHEGCNEKVSRFFSDGIIAHNTHFIDSTHYAPEQDFTSWFHGPLDTNLFLWIKDGQLKRAVLELRNEVIEYKDGAFAKGKSQDRLHYPTEDYVYYNTHNVRLTTIKSNDDSALQFRQFLALLIDRHPDIKLALKQL